MYKARFKQWGLWKYTRPADIPMLLKAKTEQTSELDDQEPEVFLHGKRVDFGRVEKYLKRRAWKRKQAGAPKTAAPTTALVRSFGSPLSSSSSSSSSPTTISTISSLPEYRVIEDSYRAIRDYFDGCFSAGRWVPESNISDKIFLATETGLVDKGKAVDEFHSRFKLAFRLLQDPAKTGAEGMKMTRICFAELPDILNGEDPTILYRILDVVQRLRQGNMEFLVIQLLQYLDGLSTRPNSDRHHPMAAIWRNLLFGMKNLGTEQTMRCAQIAASQFEAHLGEHHMKTIESKMWVALLGELSLDEKEKMIQDLHKSFEQLETFDYRNLLVDCNYASLLRKRQKLDEAAEIITGILDDPLKSEVLRGYPDMGYNVVSLLAKIRNTQGRLTEAEALYMEAIAHAKRMRSGDDVDLLDGLVFLEQCLRAQERHEDADKVLAEREEVIRQSLARVGEKENDV